MTCGPDAPSALGYYAACTDRMLLGSGIIQLGTRTPVAIAQAAITLSNLSEGRFLLGLGASGPQVIEGLHGVSFARPLTRLRETVEVVRRVVDGAPGHLEPGGVLAVEIGAGEAASTARLFEARGFRDVRTTRDYAGIERVVDGTWGAR